MKTPAGIKYEKHEWFYFKKDTFRCCKKCGGIENKKNSDGMCHGKAFVQLRGI